MRQEGDEIEAGAAGIFERSTIQENAILIASVNVGVRTARIEVFRSPVRTSSQGNEK